MKKFVLFFVTFSNQKCYDETILIVTNRISEFYVRLGRFYLSNLFKINYLPNKAASITYLRQ